MRTLAWILVGAAAFGLHEYLTSRANRPGGRLARWAVLGALLMAVAVVGPSILDRVARMASPARKLPLSFDPIGDPLATGAARAQHPEMPFPSEQAAGAAEAWRTHVLDALAARADLRLEPVQPVPYDVVKSEQVGEVRRTLIRFSAFDGTKVPAYVLEPAGEQPKGGVLVVPGHGSGIEATAGIVDEYQHHAALTLARAGYVVLTPELRGFGMLSPSPAGSHRLVAAAALTAGSSYKAMELRDLRRALTVLQSWNRVDSTRLGVTGTSLGGELAVLLAAMDERVRVTVSNSYGGAVGADSESESATDEAGQAPHGCHTMPGVNRIVAQEDWARLVAPRPLLVVRGTRNHPATVDDFERLVRHAYTARGSADSFAVEIADGVHEFYSAPTLAFFRRWL